MPHLPLKVASMWMSVGVQVVRKRDSVPFCQGKSQHWPVADSLNFFWPCLSICICSLWMCSSLFICQHFICVYPSLFMFLCLAEYLPAWLHTDLSDSLFFASVDMLPTCMTVFVYGCVYVYVCVCLSIGTCISLPFQLPVSLLALSASLLTWLPTCLSVSGYQCLSNCLFISNCVGQSPCEPSRLPINLSLIPYDCQSV